MTDAAAEIEPVVYEPKVDDTPFKSVEAALRDGGPAAAIGRLTEHLAAAGENRALLDALLLQARLELGLPLVSSGSLAGIPEPSGASTRKNTSPPSGKLVDGISMPATSRQPGRIIESSPRPSRWRLPLAAIDRTTTTKSWERSSRWPLTTVSVPSAGFELILEHYGTCPAISAFDQLAPHDQAVRSACAARLIRHLHRELAANLLGYRQPGPGATPCGDTHCRPPTNTTLAARR